MKRLFLILIVSFLFGCENTKKLQLNELSFSDINQKSILKNGIQKTYIISGYDNGLFKEGDTIEIIKYNQNGYIKNVWRKSYMYSIDEAYKYDSLNLETQKIYFTDFEAVFSFRYHFDRDHLVLYKYYIKPSMSIPEEEFSQPAGVFKFLDDGRISESIQYQNNDYGKGKKITTKYYYDSLVNALSSKEILYERSNSVDALSNPNAITKYHYSNKILDSTTTIYSLSDRDQQKLSFTKKVIYDQNGLISKAIIMDGLITYYSHIK